MSELYNCAKELHTIQSDTVRKLEEKIEQIKKHHTDCNISTTVGASTGVIGTIALIAAPFTGGLSLMVGGVAVGAMVAGAVTTVGTSIADVVMSNGFIEDVNKLVKTQEATAKKLQTLLENVKSVVMHVKEEMMGCTEDEAWAVVLRACCSGGKGVMTTIASIQGSMATTKAIKVAKDVIALQKAECTVGLSVLTHMPVGASAETIAAMGRVSAKIGTQAVTTTAKSVTKVISKTFAVVGSLVDLGLMIYGWSTEHPTLKGIEEVCEKQKESISQLNQLLEYLRSFEKFEKSLFYIQSELNGKVLDVTAQQTNPGAKVIMWDKNCPQSKNQLWYLDDQNVIHSALNDFVLQANGIGSGADIQMYPFKDCGKAEQQWFFELKKIVNKKGLCLDIRESNRNNGARVITYSCHGGPNQRWNKVPA